MAGIIFNVYQMVARSCNVSAEYQQTTSPEMSIFKIAKNPDWLIGVKDVTFFKVAKNIFDCNTLCR
jgi:hypothetical protein